MGKARRKSLKAATTHPVAPFGCLNVRWMAAFHLLVSNCVDTMQRNIFRLIPPAVACIFTTVHLPRYPHLEAQNNCGTTYSAPFELVTMRHRAYPRTENIIQFTMDTGTSAHI